MAIVPVGQLVHALSLGTALVIGENVWVDHLSALEQETGGGLCQLGTARCWIVQSSALSGLAHAHTLENGATVAEVGTWHIGWLDTLVVLAQQTELAHLGLVGQSEATSGTNVTVGLALASRARAIAEQATGTAVQWEQDVAVAGTTLRSLLRNALLTKAQTTLALATTGETRLTIVQLWLACHSLAVHVATAGIGEIFKDRHAAIALPLGTPLLDTVHTEWALSIDLTLIVDASHPTTLLAHALQSTERVLGDDGWECVAIGINGTVLVRVQLLQLARGGRQIALVRVGTSSPDAGTALTLLGQRGVSVNERRNANVLVAEQLGLSHGQEGRGHNGQEQDGNFLHSLYSSKCG